MYLSTVSQKCETGSTDTVKARSGDKDCDEGKLEASKYDCSWRQKKRLRARVLPETDE